MPSIYVTLKHPRTEFAIFPPQTALSPPLQIGWNLKSEDLCLVMVLALINHITLTHSFSFSGPQSPKIEANNTYFKMWLWRLNENVGGGVSWKCQIAVETWVLLISFLTGPGPRLGGGKWATYIGHKGWRGAKKNSVIKINTILMQYFLNFKTMQKNKMEKYQKVKWIQDLILPCKTLPSSPPTNLIPASTSASPRPPPCPQTSIDNQSRLPSVLPFPLSCVLCLSCVVGSLCQDDCSSFPTGPSVSVLLLPVFCFNVPATPH